MFAAGGGQSAGQGEHQWKNHLVQFHNFVWLMRLKIAVKNL
jgi:hypothetical protein